MFIKKILKLSLVNILTGLINFLSTIFIVKIFGLNIFGEFAIFSAYIGIITLVFVIIPPNFSIMKLQDDNDFNNILSSAYLVCNIFSIVILSTIYYINNSFLGLEVNLWLVVIYILMYSFFNLIDIQSQAKNRLNIYFYYLLLQSLLKIIIIGFIFFNFSKYDLNLLITIFIIPQLLIFLFHIFYYKDELFNIKIDIKKLFPFLYSNFTVLKNYYIEILLKRIKDNIIILMFSNFLSKDIIGLYSLLIKIGTFALSQARIIEAFFMNRKNLKSLNKIDNKIYLISFLVQVMIIVVGIVYIKLTINEYKFYLLFIYSFIAYPYMNIIIRRNKLYSYYNNKPIVYSLFLSIITVIIFYFAVFFVKSNSIYSVILTVLMSEMILSISLIYFYKREKINVN